MKAYKSNGEVFEIGPVTSMQKPKAYRPEGWENPYSQITHRVGNTVHGNFHPAHASVFEAGADAMLGGLKKEAGVVIRDTETMEIPLRYQKGRIVFIPEEE